MDLEKYAKEISTQNITHAFPCSIQAIAAAAVAAARNDRNSSNSSAMTYICIQFVCDDGNEASSTFSGT